MALSLTNSKDIVANSITVIKGNRAIDLLETIDAVTGLAPDTLNSLEKLATALNNDSNFFNFVTNGLNNKQNTLSNGTSLTGSKSLLNTTSAKIKNIVGTNLTLTADDNNLTIEAVDAYDKPNIDGKFLNKQDKFIIAASLPTGTSRLFDVSSNKFRAINVTSPMAISATSDDYLSITCDSYNKKDVDDKISALVNSAPGLLDTLGEIATYLGNPANTSTNLITLIGTKANSLDTFSKSKLDSDYYLGGLGNKRIVSLGTTENKLIFEIQDTMGTIFNDAYYQALALKMDTTTKNIMLYT
jgi:hypothetical protein